MKTNVKIRKAVWLLVVCGMLLSLLSVSAAAQIDVYEGGLPDGFSANLGYFACANGEDFSRVGKREIQWAPEVAAKLDMTDGDITDWKVLGMALGCEPVSITETNMVSWVGGEQGVRDPGMPDAWGVEAYFMADPDYLYMIFDVTDSDFAYGDPEQMYNGDAIQLSIDFGGRMEEILLQDPYELTSKTGIFYSFSCEGDGAPIRIMRQESDQDGMMTEANGDGIKGATRRTENGWSAEIAFSWDQLYNDYSWKAWENPRIYYGSDALLPIKVNMTLCYLNRTETAGEITWAASATRGIKVDGVPVLSWTVFDNGIYLELPYEDGLHINSDYILKIYSDPVLPDQPETEPARETEIATEPPEIPREPPVTYETEADSSVEYDTEVAEGLDPTLNAVLEKYGCSGTVSVGAAFLLVTAVALVLKKKD